MKRTGNREHGMLNHLVKGGVPYILLMVLCLSSLSAEAQVKVSAALENNRILIGDQVQLHLYVSHGPGIKIQGADYSAVRGIPQIEVLAESPWDTLPSGRETVLQQHLTLTSFDSGYYRIPPIPVQYINDNGETAVTSTNDLALEVNTILMPGDSLQLAPIKPILEEPVKFIDFLPYLVIFLVLLSIILGIYFFRRKTAAAAQPKPAVIRSPHEIALEKLASLKTRKLWQQGQIKEYHSELSYTMREYLENRFQVPALESTTSEIMQSLRPVALEEGLSKQLRELLQTADLVKFAKAQPAPEKHDEVMRQAESFVENTIPVPEPVLEEEAAITNSEALADPGKEDS